MEKNGKIKPKLHEDKYYSCECGSILIYKHEKCNTTLNTLNNVLPKCLNCGKEIDWQIQDIMDHRKEK